MKDEKILTLHPKGKNGVNISRAKYDQVRAAIIDTLGSGELTATQLSETLVDRLQGNFAGSVMWYSVAVKQDLEARGILKARPKTKPPRWYVDHEAI